MPIAELDGTVSGDFFTVLCVGQGFTEDQWMNVYSFSMLRHWLLTYHSVSSGNIAADTGMTHDTNHDLLLSHAREAPYVTAADYMQGASASKTISCDCEVFAPPDLCFHHPQQTGCSSASPSHTPTPFLMVRLRQFMDRPCMSVQALTLTPSDFLGGRHRSTCDT